MTVTEHGLPKVILVRHGQTAWSMSGQHTGRTDIPLTAKGEQIILDEGPKVYGEGLLIDPTKIGHVYVSPRQRATKTLELLEGLSPVPLRGKEVTERVREWDYGIFEGKIKEDIYTLKPGWRIFEEGAIGGESTDEMTARVDSLIKDIRKFQQDAHAKGEPANVLIVTHGHYSRCFVTRWCDFPLIFGERLQVDAGAVTVLGYLHHSYSESALLNLNIAGDHRD